MTRLKFGIHTGVGSRRSGWGEHIATLNAAGISVGMTAVDDAGAIVELVKSGIEHGIKNAPVYRMLDFARFGIPDNGDLPDYHKPPDEAADEMFWRIQQRLLVTPELTDTILAQTYLLITNEPRTAPDANDPNYADMHPADWLGRYEYHLSRLIVENTTANYLAFGFNAGTPEPMDWSRSGMEKFLLYAAEQNGRIGTAVHEGMVSRADFIHPDTGEPLNWRTDNAMYWYPYVIGRFEAINDRCDRLGIERIPIAITEFAWLYNNFPVEHNYAKVTADVMSVGEMVAKSPNVLTVNIWNTELGWGGIADKVVPFLPVLRDLTLSVVFDPALPPALPTNEEITAAELWNFTVAEQIARGIRLNPATAIAGEIERRGLIPVINEVPHPARDGRIVGVGEDLRGKQPRRVIVWHPSEGIYTQTKESEETPPPPPPPPPSPPPPPPPGNGHALIGLHASADAHIPDAEFGEFAELKPGVIKVQTSNDKFGVARLSEEHPDATFIMRIYLDMSQKKASPSDFVEWSANSVNETIAAIGFSHKILIEVHNEPNLTQEGLGISWRNGREFGRWLLQVVDMLRRSYPGIQIMYPGLSPGGSVSGIRADHVAFIEESRSAVNSCDALGVHTYWSNAYPMAAALAVVDDYIARFPGKPIWITEASNNKSAPTEQKASEYAEFYRQLRKRPQAQGVTFFVASATAAAFESEVWVGRGMGKLVRRKLG